MATYAWPIPSARQALPRRHGSQRASPPPLAAARHRLPKQPLGHTRRGTVPLSRRPAKARPLRTGSDTWGRLIPRPGRVLVCNCDGLALARDAPVKITDARSNPGPQKA